MNNQLLLSNATRVCGFSSTLYKRNVGRVGVLYKTTSAELPFLSFILVSFPRRLIPKRSMNTWPHWRVIPDLPREAVLNIWCTGCAIIIACWV